LAYPPEDRDLPSPVAFETFPVYQPYRKFQNRTWLHVLLFVLTLATTTGVGILHYLSFAGNFDRRPVAFGWDSVAQGFWYSLTILAILGAHEMGHYLYCRRYNVDATLPFFIPLPPFIFLTGTLGAVIRIRERFPTRTALFDIGVAGPIAGFVVLVPALFYGLSLSEVVVTPPESSSLLLLGEPALFRWAVDLMHGPMPAGHEINMHPIVFAAWFGMLATAANLLPFGQLDGGHLTYALLRHRAAPISVLTVVVAVVMTWFSLSWLLMTAIMVAMLYFMGPRHPPTLYDHEPLPRSRRVVAAIALAIFVVCFTPTPLQVHLGDEPADSQHAHRIDVDDRPATNVRP
jgi:membrane-associated protease RseP (regulator of RpoE activity)